MAVDRRAGRASSRIAADLERSGARIERLRMTVAVIAVLAVLLVAAVLWLGRAFTVDPTRRAVDELTVPGWAAASVHDETYGSRWCLGECRVRMRTWTSEGTVDDTANEYWQAVLNAGWTPADSDECIGGLGEEGCYVRDELYLELWVVPIECGDRYELCVASEVTAVVAAQAAMPRLAEEHRAQLRLASFAEGAQLRLASVAEGAQLRLASVAERASLRLASAPSPPLTGVWTDRPVALDVRYRKVRSVPRRSRVRARLCRWHRGRRVQVREDHATTQQCRWCPPDGDRGRPCLRRPWQQDGPGASGNWGSCSRGSGSSSCA